jgi:hypothetical protein
VKNVLISVYEFSELTPAAKGKAREWYRDGMDYAWTEESRQSIERFCERYGAKLTDWSISAGCPIHYRLDMPAGMLRGVKLRDINRDDMPTGYCLDCALYMTFHDEWKRTSDPRAAFRAAIDAAFQEWREDMEYQLSDEAADESIEINGYQFTESGKFFNGGIK